MKNLTYLIFITFISYTGLSAQSIQHAFKWEASTISGSIYMGITKTRNEALLEIQQLMAEKKGDQGVLDFEIRFSPIQSPTGKSVFEEFVNLTNDQSTRTFLTREDLEAIRINRKWGRANCIQYYSKARNFKNKKAMLYHLDKNVLVFEKFLFLSQNGKAKEIYANSTNQTYVE